MSKYDELKKLAEAATPGPWSYDGSYICPARVEGETTYVETWRAVADSHQTENVRFIAAANPAAILELIEYSESLEGLYRMHKATEERQMIELRATVDDLSALVRRLVQALSKAAPDNDLPEKAMDYLKRKGLQGSPLRDQEASK